MAIEFRVPELGENITEADVAEILVKEGDRIEAEQSVMELETEKAVVELPCPHAGVVTRVHVGEGDTVQVGAVVLTIDDAADVGSDQVTADVPATAAVPDEPSQGAAETIPETEGSPPERERHEPALPASSSAAVDDRPPPPAGPATRRMARKLGVDLYQVRGTGKSGRILPEDVEDYVRGRLAAQEGGTAPSFSPTLPDFSKFGPIERRKLSKLRRTSAAQLSTSWQVIPHVTQHDEADVTELESVRRRYMQSAGKDGPKITVTAIVLKACAQLLSEMPHFNSSLDFEAGELIVKDYFHIGVAVDTEHGLVVPVIRDADQKSILEIASELTEIAGRARDRKLGLEDMQGGTFTITNLGGIGGTSFTPIVNHPEVAILGLSRSQKRPAIVDGGVQERLILPLSLSYDHRVIDGADAARFVVRLCALLSQPFGLLANV